MVKDQQNIRFPIILVVVTALISNRGFGADRFSGLPDDVQTVSKWIIGLQYATPNKNSFGALRIHHAPAHRTPTGTAYYRVVPYHANLGLRGLLQSSPKQQQRLIERWIVWYVKHLNMTVRSTRDCWRSPSWSRTSFPTRPRRTGITVRRPTSVVRYGGELFDQQGPTFHVAKFENGSLKKADFDVWYPDSVSQAWPILFDVIPAESETAQRQMEFINAHGSSRGQGDWANAKVDPSGFPWSSIGYAALLTGDSKRALRHLESVKQEKFPKSQADRGFAWSFAVDDAGWMLMTLTALNK